MRETEEIMNKKFMKPKEIEKLIGRLNRLAFIIPGENHFLYSIRQTFNMTRKKIRSNREDMKQDLEL